MSQQLRTLMPRPPTSHPRPVDLLPPPTTPQAREAEERKPTDFYCLPAELRIQIYSLVLEGVIVHILPKNSHRNRTHPLARVSRLFRADTVPLIHKICPHRASVIDFDFQGLIEWLGRVPQQGMRNLMQNANLRVWLQTTDNVPGELAWMRKWLALRADQHRLQPKWEYRGTPPTSKLANDMRRRLRRMTEPGKQEELRKMLQAIGVLRGGPD